MSSLSPHVNDKRNAPFSVNILEEFSGKQKKTYCTKLHPGLK